MRLVYPNITHYHAMMRVDDDFLGAGELPYVGAFSKGEYKDWLGRLHKHMKGEQLPHGYSAYEILLMLDDKGDICALGQLRLTNEPPAVTWAGHIGYSVPPSKRQRGYATACLRLLLDECKARGLAEVLVTCDTTNTASRRVIEKCGGEYMDTYHGEGYVKLRYLFSQT